MAFWGVVVYFTASALLLVLGDTAVLPEDVRSDSRIVSGWEAEVGQFPYQLSLRMVDGTGSVFACGGTIIHNNWGLTAAHCTARRVTLVIRAGTVNTTQPSLIFETTTYYNHPLYLEILAGTVQPNDIGVINFERKLEYNELIQPIRMHRSSDRNRNYSGVRLIATGWGRLWTGGSSPENMNWVFLLGVTNAECLAAFGGSNIIQDSTICAAYYNVTSQSTCQGDSGGGLVVVDDDGVFSQVGVTSFVSSTGCHTEFPAGFVRPGHYHNWFKEVTGIDFDWEWDGSTPEPQPKPESEESNSSESSGSDSSESESDSEESKYLEEGLEE